METNAPLMQLFHAALDRATKAGHGRSWRAAYEKARVTKGIKDAVADADETVAAASRETRP